MGYDIVEAYLEIQQIKDVLNKLIFSLNKDPAMKKKLEEVGIKLDEKG